MTMNSKENFYQRAETTMSNFGKKINVLINKSKYFRIVKLNNTKCMLFEEECVPVICFNRSEFFFNFLNNCSLCVFTRFLQWFLLGYILSFPRDRPADRRHGRFLPKFFCSKSSQNAPERLKTCFRCKKARIFYLIRQKKRMEKINKKSPYMTKKA